jgi:hypothetical protein
MQKRVISPEEFAEEYKEAITDDLYQVIANLQGIASEADPAVQKNLNRDVEKLQNAMQILCEVPPPCTDPRKSS